MNTLPAISDFMSGPKPPGTPDVVPALEPAWLDLGSSRKLFYYRGGAPERLPVLFIHGIGGWAEHWLPTLPAFQGYRWLIPDLPGFGRSSPPEVPDGSTFCAALLRLLDAERAEKCIVVGNSLGGGFALRLAIDQPDRVVRLVLATAAGILRRISTVFKLALLPLIGELMLAHQPSILRIRWRSQFGRKQLVTPGFLDEIARFSRRYDCRRTYLRTLRHGVRLSGLQEAVTAELPRLRQPVLIVWGTRDRVIPLVHGQYAVTHLPDARLEVFEGAGHYPHWEQPDRFNRLVREFLADSSLEACA